MSVCDFLYRSIYPVYEHRIGPMKMYVYMKLHFIFISPGPVVYGARACLFHIHIFCCSCFFLHFSSLFLSVIHILLHSSSFSLARTVCVFYSNFCCCCCCRYCYFFLFFVFVCSFFVLLFRVSIVDFIDLAMQYVEIFE